VQEILFERGITVTHEAIRQWCLKFGQAYTNPLKHRRAQPGDKWHLAAVRLIINGQRHSLWRAVDQNDNVPDILVQSRSNKQAAKKFFRTLLKGLQYVPRVIITDKRKSYGAAKHEILPGVKHRQSWYLNNRCEHSHRPTWPREYRMQGSSPQDMPSDSCPRMVPLPNTSAPDSICCPPRSAAKRCGSDSRGGLP
jgi:putative transposase